MSTTNTDISSQALHVAQLFQKELAKAILRTLASTNRAADVPEVSIELVYVPRNDANHREKLQVTGWISA